MSGRVEEDEGVLPEVEAITVFDRHQPISRNRFHRPEDLRFFRPECLPRARHEAGRIHEMLVTALVDVDLGLGHGFEQESGSPGVIQVNVGHDAGPDAAWPPAERTDRWETSLRVPR